MLDKEESRGELNKIISVIVDKQEILSDDCEEMNNA